MVNVGARGGRETIPACVWMTNDNLNIEQGALAGTPDNAELCAHCTAEAGRAQ